MGVMSSRTLDHAVAWIRASRTGPVRSAGAPGSLRRSLHLDLVAVPVDGDLDFHAALDGGHDGHVVLDVLHLLAADGGDLVTLLEARGLRGTAGHDAADFHPVLAAVVARHEAKLRPAHSPTHRPGCSLHVRG